MIIRKKGNRPIPNSLAIVFVKQTRQSARRPNQQLTVHCSQRLSELHSFQARANIHPEQAGASVLPTKVRSSVARAVQNRATLSESEPDPPLERITGTHGKPHCGVHWDKTDMWCTLGTDLWCTLGQTGLVVYTGKGLVVYAGAEGARGVQ